MSDYSEYFLNTRASIAQLECLEISHPNFSQVFYCVRNHANGVTVIHEDDTEHDYIYVPMRLKLTGARDDLEHILHVELGDLGELVPQQVDLIRAEGETAFKILPTVIYRVYRHDVLDTVLYGPLLLQLKTFTFTRNGCAFEAKAPSLNISRTGELYTLPRFPMLRGVL